MKTCSHPTPPACAEAATRRRRRAPNAVAEAASAVIAVSAPDFERKLCAPDTVSARVRCLPRPLVMTNGVFDLLHRGHVTGLAQARALGASLLVAVNDDASARRLRKGGGRPFNCCDDRMALLAALTSTDLVTCFDGDDALAVVDAVQPDIYVKGGDYDVAATREGQAVIAHGGRAAALPFVHYTSTSLLAEKIRRSRD